MWYKVDLCVKRGEEEAERVQSKSLIQAEVKDTKVRSQYAHLCKSGKSNDDEFKGKEAAKRHKIQRKDVTLVFSMQRFQPCGLQLPQAKEENNTLQFLHGDPEIYIISPAGLGPTLGRPPTRICLENLDTSKCGTTLLGSGKPRFPLGARTRRRAFKAVSNGQAWMEPWTLFTTLQDRHWGWVHSELAKVGAWECWWSHCR